MKTEEEIKQELRELKDALNIATKHEEIFFKIQIDTLKWVLEDEIKC